MVAFFPTKKKNGSASSVSHNRTEQKFYKCITSSAYYAFNFSTTGEEQVGELPSHFWYYLALGT